MELGLRTFGYWKASDRTTYMVKIVPMPDQNEGEAGVAAKAVDGAVQGVNRSMSTYQDDSG